MTIRITGSVQPIVNDLRRVSGEISDRASAAALNRLNGRVRTEAVRALAENFQSKQRSIRRQVRIPRSMRATINRLRAGGVWSLYVPMAIAPTGARIVFDRSGPLQPLGRSGEFSATVHSRYQTAKRGHRGVFVRAPRRHPNWRRERRRDGQMTELPIQELFTEQTEAAAPFFQKAMRAVAPEWQRLFDQQMARFLRGGRR